jgi:hypothetical protein
VFRSFVIARFTHRDHPFHFIVITRFGDRDRVFRERDHPFREP